MKRVGILAGMLALSACSGWGDAQTATTDGYSAALRTKPAPLKVGSEADLKLALTHEGVPAEGCAVTFQQHMPGMEMSTDTSVISMSDKGAGLYTGTALEFAMGGDWRIEITFTCAGQQHIAAFTYALEWPE
ncbi:MAG: FixH family protein [Gammaproteobacteria bacterium]|nr:FixH family protein [Gammaproteobacteria bacterium]